MSVLRVLSLVAAVVASGCAAGRGRDSRALSTYHQKQAAIAQCLSHGARTTGDKDRDCATVYDLNSLERLTCTDWEQLVDCHTCVARVRASFATDSTDKSIADRSQAHANECRELAAQCHLLQGNAERSWSLFRTVEAANRRGEGDPGEIDSSAATDYYYFASSTGMHQMAAEFARSRGWKFRAVTQDCLVQNSLAPLAEYVDEINVEPGCADCSYRGDVDHLLKWDPDLEDREKMAACVAAITSGTVGGFKHWSDKNCSTDFGGWFMRGKLERKNADREVQGGNVVWNPSVVSAALSPLDALELRVTTCGSMSAPATVGKTAQYPFFASKTPDTLIVTAHAEDLDPSTSCHVTRIVVWGLPTMTAQVHEFEVAVERPTPGLGLRIQTTPRPLAVDDARWAFLLAIAEEKSLARIEAIASSLVADGDAVGAKHFLARHGERAREARAQADGYRALLSSLTKVAAQDVSSEAVRLVKALETTVAKSPVTPR